MIEKSWTRIHKQKIKLEQVNRKLKEAEGNRKIKKINCAAIMR